MKEYIAKTLFGLEDVLVKELNDLGAEEVTKMSRAVGFKADKETLYKIHLWSSVALRIIEPVYSFTAQDTDELYKRLLEVDWSMIMDIEDTFKIDAVVFSTIFTHSQYAGLKMKDAICDFWREEEGKRPPGTGLRLAAPLFPVRAREHLREREKKEWMRMAISRSHR